MRSSGRFLLLALHLKRGERKLRQFWWPLLSLLRAALQLSSFCFFGLTTSCPHTFYRLEKKASDMSESAGKGRSRKSIITTSGSHERKMSGKGKKNRREEVSAEVYSGGKTNQEYVKKCIPKDGKTRGLIERAVEESVLFASLRREEKDSCVDAFEKVEMSEGDKVIVQGTVGNDFYVVVKGVVNVIIEKGGREMRMAVVTAGQSFGELALMYNTPRQATVKCAGPCLFYKLNRQDFRGMLLARLGDGPHAGEVCGHNLL